MLWASSSSIHLSVAGPRHQTMTGDHVPGTPMTVEERQDQLEDVIARFLPAANLPRVTDFAPQPVDQRCRANR